jgi:hypothetical protein
VPLLSREALKDIQPLHPEGGIHFPLRQIKDGRFALI